MIQKKTFNAEKVNNHIVKWLRDYVKNAGVKGFVIGISGGIDSALTSTLCAQTGLPTLCVEMPIHQAENQILRGQEHINFLKQKYSNVSSAKTDLTHTYDTFAANLPLIENTDQLNLTLANTRARLRMTTLYYYAGIHGYLVVGTGNKVEDFGVGFFTKYGDGGVDISPIADLLKSEVRMLAEYLGIVSSIIKAKPTDGLFGDDRTDEDQLGANYDELEEAMIAYEIGAKSDDFTGRKREVFNIYVRLNKINQHKMQPIPICYVNNIIT